MSGELGGWAAADAIISSTPPPRACDCMKWTRVEDVKPPANARLLWRVRGMDGPLFWIDKVPGHFEDAEYLVLEVKK